MRTYRPRGKSRGVARRPETSIAARRGWGGVTGALQVRTRMAQLLHIQRYKPRRLFVMSVVTQSRSAPTNQRRRRPRHTLQTTLAQRVPQLHQARRQHAMHSCRNPLRPLLAAATQMPPCFHPLHHLLLHLVILLQPDWHRHLTLHHQRRRPKARARTARGDAVE